MNLGTINSRLRQRPVEQAACGAHEGTSRQILAIPWLLSDEHDPRVRTALANRSVCVPRFQKVTRLAPCSDNAQLSQIWFRRDQRRCRGLPHTSHLSSDARYDAGGGLNLDTQTSRC